MIENLGSGFTYDGLGFGGIRQWMISWYTTQMMMNKVTTYLRLLVKRL